MSTTADTNQKSPPARTLGAIDIGSNSIRMAIAQAMPDGKIEILERLQRGVRLGQDTFRTGRIRGTTMRATVLILRDFMNVLKLYNADVVKVVATSAVREAGNSDAFLDRILMATGFEVDIINSSDESRLTVAAVRQEVGRKQLTKQSSVIVEVGGGNTEINVLRKGQIATSRNLAIGSIRLQELLSTSTESADRASDMIRQQVAGIISSMKGLLRLGQVRSFYAVGGDARWAAERVGRRAKIANLRSVSRRDLDKLVSKSRHYTADKLSKIYGLPFSEAETLIPALLVYQVLLKSTGAGEIIVSNVSMRDGLLLDLARQAAGSVEKSAYEDIIRSATSMAKKYGVDLKHATHTRQTSVRLFDELAAEHVLDKRCRLLLEVAALLHEIGTFVSGRAYHKHSFYLIANSEISGLTQDELQLVAHVARYHRRSRPKPAHIEYMAMPRERRMTTNKLAALLRVADALDASRTQHVRNINCRISDEYLQIITPTTADVSLEERMLAMQGDLFEDIYGLQIRLEREVGKRYGQTKGFKIA
ncbi:MAG: Ppx/GppA phosphatase family protein [Sedimentisphaerales bacterium]